MARSITDYSKRMTVLSFAQHRGLASHMLESGDVNGRARRGKFNDLKSTIPVEFAGRQYSASISMIVPCDTLLRIVLANGKWLSIVMAGWLQFSFD